MTDTTTGSAAVRLHAADEPEELDSLIDAAAGDEANGGDDLYSVFDIEVEEEDPFESLDDLLGVEKSEREGRMVTWDALPDARVHIAHLQSALQARQKLERELREKKGWTYVKYPDGQLPGMTEEYLWWEAMPGTAVKGWEGASFEGRPFTKRNFLRLMRDSVRFRKFVFAHTKSVDDLRRKMKEEAEGN
jgi:hypothetical protein